MSILASNSPIQGPPIANEYLSGLPRNKPLSDVANNDFWNKRMPDRIQNVRDMGNDTPIQAYSLRDDYERNAEWYPTKSIRDWKMVDDKQPGYQTAHGPKPSQPINPKSMRGRVMKNATQHYDGKTTSPFENDRSRG